MKPGFMQPEQQDRLVLMTVHTNQIWRTIRKECSCFHFQFQARQEVVTNTTFNYGRLIENDNQLSIKPLSDDFETAFIWMTIP